MDQIQTADADETAPEVEPATTTIRRKQKPKWHRLLSRIHSQTQPSTADAVHFFNSPMGVHYSDDEEEEDSVGECSEEVVRVTVEEEAEHLGSKTVYQPAFYYPASWTAGLMTTLSSQLPVSLEDKLDDVTQLWSPEEDGLHVGSPPKCPERRWRMLERRLVTQTGADKNIKTKWFRSDGTVAVLPDPLRPYLVRNIIPSAQDLRPVYLPNGKKETETGAGKQLDQAYPLHLFVSGLYFDHHWLFGPENVLAARLRRRWALYTSADGDDHPSAAKMDVLGRKLRALYQAHDEAVDLLDRLQFNGADAAVMTAQLQRIASYREAIGWTRGDYYAASARRLSLVRSMLADWKQLKALRKSQGFSLTSCKLVVNRGPPDHHQQPSQQLDWDEEIERQMDESRRLFKEHVRADTDRYKRHKAQWRAKRRRKREEMSKKKRSSSSSDSEVDDGKRPESETDDEKPEAPPDRHFDEVQTRADILKIMEESLTPPGETPVKLSWSQITPTASNTDRETRRIEAVKKCVYQLKIFVNGEETSASDTFRLCEDFTAEDFQQAFHIWIRDKPRNISMQLSYKTQQNFKKWLSLADVTVPIPSPRASFAGQPESQLKFQSNLVQSPVEDLGNVGCGLKRDEEADWTNGIIVAKIGWGTDARGTVVAPNINTPLAPKGADPTEWVNQVQLDLNDPANAEALDKLEKLKRLEWRGSSGKDTAEVLRDDGESFCSKEQLDANVRFQLLRRRADETKPFVHLTMIPTRPDEIPNHLIHMVDASGTTGSSFERVEEEDSLNPLDVARRRGQRRWLKIYPMVADRLSSSSQKRLQLADLVMEDHIPDISTFGGQLLPVFFKAHRPLRPERKERNPVPLLAGLALNSTEQVSVKVNIIRALNLPHKIDRGDNRRTDSTDSMAHPFVEVTFQKSSARTTAGNGSSPTWNQELNLPIQFPEGIRSLAYLQSIRDDLFIQLFDEVVVDILDDDRQRDVSVHQRYERHWLGGFKIPFQVVYKWSKIEGTFALNIPLVPIGYQYNHSNHEGPLLTVLISIYPVVSPPKLGQHKGPSMEDEGFVDYVNGWRDGLFKEFPSLTGLVNPLVINEKAMSVYVGRYLTPLEPPEELKGSSDEETLRNLCQFVSSIPSASNNQPVLLPRIWLTCQTVLEWLVGGDEERAVLLYNYLAHLHYEAYILLGMAVPEGETAYVLYKDKMNHSMRMINPSTGFITNVSDPTCAMQQVWALFNQNDFWVNTHSKVHPSQLQYQVGKVSDWRPLFSRRFPNPKLATVQSPEKLLYPAASGKDIRQLEESIIDHLKQCFMKWRKTVRTKWNRHAALVFRDILSQAARGDSVPTSSNLDELLETYKVFGVPLKTAYVDLEGLSDLLYATGLHRHHGIEFALSVFVKPYPNRLLHVFIYSAYLENL